MALTPSTMLPLGSAAPDFAVTEVDGTTARLADFAGKPLLVVFMCNHCPYVKHVRAELSQLTTEYLAKGVAVIGISSNDTERYPQDGLDAMRVEKRDAGYRFPYCLDADQAAAKAYRAACTPDFFLFDWSPERARRLHYRGQLDGSRPNSGVPVTGADLRAALDLCLSGKPGPAIQKPSMGCNIKWKPGNEPDYFQARR